MKIQAGRYYTILDRSEMFEKEWLQEAYFKVGGVLKITKVTRYALGVYAGWGQLFILTEDGYLLNERDVPHMKPATRKQIAKYKRRNIVC